MQFTLTFDYSSLFTATDGDSMTYKLSSTPPSWVTSYPQDNTVSTLQGTPDSGSEGQSVTIELIATDKDGDSSAISFSLSVNNIPAKSGTDTNWTGLT